MFVWDETDFLECLETEPVIEEDGISLAWSVARDGLRLDLTVFQYDGDVLISLFRDGLDEPVFDLAMRDCAGARLVRHADREWLEIGPGNIFSGRYDGVSPLPYGVAVTVRPHIRMRFFANDV